jgi:ADP-ribose pyrophosphatase YjhB (NUDIX family)
MKALLTKAWKILKLPKGAQIAIMRATQDEFLIGVTGVILNDKNEVLVCKHTYRGGKKWSLPGGYLKGKEHPSEGLAREIEEETGLIVRVDEQFNLRTDRETARIDISLVGKLIGSDFRPSHEVSEAEFFAFDKLPLLSQNQLVLIKDVLKSKESGPKEIEETEPKNLTTWEKIKFVLKN